MAFVDQCGHCGSGGAYFIMSCRIQKRREGQHEDGHGNKDSQGLM